MDNGKRNTPVEETKVCMQLCRDKRQTIHLECWHRNEKSLRDFMLSVFVIHGEIWFRLYLFLMVYAGY